MRHSTLGIDDTQHNNTQHNSIDNAVVLSVVMLGVVMLSVVMVRVVAPCNFKRSFFTEVKKFYSTYPGRLQGNNNFSNFVNYVNFFYLVMTILRKLALIRFTG
jgi:hypothetical protein